MINSVQNQTYKNFEFIIVDDASWDPDTIRILKEYETKDPRIKVVRLHTNSGLPSYPRNVGIELAKGEFINIMDDDDLIHPEKLEK